MPTLILQVRTPKAIFIHVTLINFFWQELKLFSTALCQRLTNFFCQGPDRTHLDLVAIWSLLGLLASAVAVRKLMQAKHKQMGWLCFNKMLLMETEILILFNFYVLQIIFLCVFFSKNVKIVVSSQDYTKIGVRPYLTYRPQFAKPFILTPLSYSNSTVLP